jgi:hypothetical protein
MPGPEQIALLIDAENVSHHFSEQILCEVDAIGDRVSEVHVYGVKTSCRGWMKALHHRCAKRTSLPPTGKNNRSDMALILDAILMPFRDGITHICLASSDTDFVPLLRRLKSEGCRTTIFAESKARRSLRQCADRFVLLRREVRAGRPSATA